MEKILISACLIGDKCKYNGESNALDSSLINALLEKYELVPFCPEVGGGLPTPRVPSERREDRVVNKNNKDVTKNFLIGAERALDLCLYLNIKVAILKDNSPSCGSTRIYNGRFENRLIKGEGVTTELLRRKGIRIISENEIEELLKE